MPYIMFALIIITQLYTPTYSHPGKLDRNRGHYSTLTGKYHFHTGYQTPHYNKKNKLYELYLRQAALRRPYKPYHKAVKVSFIQSGLYLLGHYFSSIDGLYDQKTRIAIRNFQRRHQLPINGKMDRKTTQLFLYKINQAQIK